MEGILLPLATSAIGCPLVTHTIDSHVTSHPYNEPMSEFAHELPTSETRQLLARGRTRKLLTMLIALFGLHGGSADHTNDTHFPTTLGIIEPNANGYRDPFGAPLKHTNDDCVIQDPPDPNELTTA